MCIAIGWLFGLNRLKIYLAANLVNPLILPAILFAEVQTGSWIRRGQGYPLSMSAISSSNVWAFGGDLLLGSVVIGGVLGALAGVATYASLGRAYRDPEFTRLVREAADRYLGTTMTAWEFARAKLRNDPVYRAVLLADWLPRHGRLVDVGCGQGLLLALLAEARVAATKGAWPASWPEPPALELVGIELRTRMSRLARHALGGDATIATGDAREADFGRADIIVIFDVLHLIDAASQVDIVRRAASALEPTGRLVVREADRSAGWRFGMVRLGNRLTALVRGRWFAPFAFRTADDWRRLLRDAGLDVEVRPMGDGTPFANVLIVGVKRERRG
jgi:SAM-dependent methyltransferase